MSESARAPRRASRRAIAAALSAAIMASAFVLAPAASVAAYDGGGDTYVYFSTQPLGASWGYTPTGQSGVAWSIQPVVSIEGYPADATYNYTATLSVSGGGSGSLSCSGGTTVQMNGSDAYFRGCSIELARPGLHAHRHRLRDDGHGDDPPADDGDEPPVQHRRRRTRSPAPRRCSSPRSPSARTWAVAARAPRPAASGRSSRSSPSSTSTAAPSTTTAWWSSSRSRAARLRAAGPGG